MNKTKTAL